MKKLPQAFDAFSFLDDLAEPMYCQNDKCERYKYITAVGLNDTK